jgi:hypothetical protein
VIGPSFARFRLSTASDLSPIGAAPDGEVEDYQVTLVSSAIATTLHIQSIGSGTIVITFNGGPNRAYRVEYADRLASPLSTMWLTLGMIVADTEGVGLFTNTVGSESRFYRTVFP